MTAVLPEPVLQDPYELFWATARDTTVHLTPDENKVADEIERRGHHGGLATSAVVLAAAFLLYRRHLARRLAEQITEAEPTRTAIQAALGAIWVAFSPSWGRMVVPALISGYRAGMKEAKQGHIPDEYLMEMAYEYAAQLGDHIHQTSSEAILSGYQAQVNRKVARRRAFQAVLQASGVTPRAMNALVGIWTSESGTTYLTSTPPQTTPDSRAKQLIAADLLQRSKLIGENEAWATKSQGKMIAWFFAQEAGLIPENATRVWITKKDERVCQYCGPMHKRNAPLREKFDTAQGDVWTPPLHPRCRCEIALSTTGEISKSAFFAEAEHPRHQDGRFRDKPKPLVAQPTRSEVDAWFFSLFGPHWQAAMSADEKAQSSAQQREEQLVRREPLQRRGELKRIEPLKRITPEELISRRESIDRFVAREQQKVAEQRSALAPESTGRYRHLPEGQFIMTIFGGGEQPEIPGELMETDDIVEFYSNTKQDIDLDGMTPFQNAIHSYWDDKKENIVQRYYSYYPDSQWWIDDVTGYQWFVSEHDFRAALDYALEGGFHDDYVTLTRQETHGGLSRKRVSLHNLSQDLHLDELVEMHKPTVYATDYLNSNGGDVYPGQSGYATNPGTWRVREYHGDSIWSSGAYIDRPYRVFYLEPDTPHQI